MDVPYQQANAVGHGQRTTKKGQSQGMRWSRFSLRVLSLVCGCASIGFSAFYYSNWTIGPLIMMGPPAILSIVWSIVDIILLSIRRGVHPAACIIVDALVTLALAALSGVIGFTISKLSDSGWYFAFFQGEEGVEYLRIVLAFGILGALFHLTALILAIYELRSRRRASTQKYVAGHHDGSFINQQQSNFGEAPPAYSGPRSMQQDTTYNPPDEISALQPLYELPGKKIDKPHELGQGNFYVIPFAPNRVK